MIICSSTISDRSSRLLKFVHAVEGCVQEGVRSCSTLRRAWGCLSVAAVPCAHCHGWILPLPDSAPWLLAWNGVLFDVLRGVGRCTSEHTVSLAAPQQ
eukprot:341380-Pelagomonas_calceolata.AAC.1